MPSAKTLDPSHPAEPAAAHAVPPASACASTDPILAQRLAAGDETVLADLYERYGSLIHAMAYRVVKDHQLAEECTQDVFVTLWRRASSYDANRGRLTTWLLTITRNRAIELVRRRNARRTDPYAEVEVTGTAPDPAIASIEADTAHAVAEAMTQLPQPQYEALRLAYFDGLSQSEIAARLEVPLGTVKGRLRLALRRLETVVDRDALAA